MDRLPQAIELKTGLAKLSEVMRLYRNPIFSNVLKQVGI